MAPTNALEAHEAALLADDKQALVTQLTGGSSGTVAVEPIEALVTQLTGGSSVFDCSCV